MKQKQKPKVTKPVGLPICQVMVSPHPNGGVIISFVENGVVVNEAALEREVSLAIVATIEKFMGAVVQ